MGHQSTPLSALTSAPTTAAPLCVANFIHCSALSASPNQVMIARVFLPHSITVSNVDIGLLDRRYNLTAVIT